MMRRFKDEIKRAVIAQDKIRTKHVELFTSRLNKFLQRYIPEILNLEGMDAAEAANIIGGLNQGLIDAGLADVVKGIRGAYADELSAISTRFSISDLKKVFSGADRSVVDELINFDTSKVTNLISPYIDDIGATVMRAVVGGESPDIQALLDKSTDLIESQVATEVDTLLSGFSRAVTANKAAEFGLELFLYIGPDDKITRDFCHEVLSKDPAIYSIDEIRKLDNDQGLDPLIYGGGYNCRHQWAAISEEEAISMGWKRGD